MRTPKLIKIDLKKCVPYKKEGGSGYTHPDINTRSSYLANINGEYYVGNFSMQWYGLSFDDWGMSGIELNQENINGLWRISSR